MLKSLKIYGLAVIDTLEVEFHTGLNVLTGETGSGKSIIVDALSLLLGARGSSAQIRSGENQATVEGVFELAGRRESSLFEVMDELGLERERTLTLRREIYLTGRSRMFVNGSSITLSVLRNLLPFLSEIYGQGEQRSLLSVQSHRELLDKFGKCDPLSHKVRQLFVRFKSAEKELAKIVNDMKEQERSKDYLQHQLTEIDAIDPQSGEDNQLLTERRILVHAERIMELGSNAYYNLYESDESVTARLTLIRRQLEELGGLVGNDEVALESLLSGIASLTDVAEALRRYGNGIEYSPERLLEVEARLAELEKLKRKYGTDLEGIIKIKDDLMGKLSQSVDLAARTESLSKEVTDLRDAYIEWASKLSACRRAAAPLLEKKVSEGLGHVAMEQARFLVSVDTHDFESAETETNQHSWGAEDNDSPVSFFSSAGADHVEFLLSANPGETPRPLSYVASGGELSRVMLALRTADREEGGSETLVFDEIDTGIGGRVAEAVGTLLKALSASHQIFCVTHQAQIAKFADHHFVVTKLVEKSRTKTYIREVTEEDRISELSRMIGGDEKAEKTRAAAHWLLDNAKSSKRRRTKGKV